MTATQPTIRLNNGVELPALGFGVFQTPPDVTQAAVEEALRVGYRLVDTAASYVNEPEVGAAIAASGIDRSELFIQTKVWVTNYSYDGALHAFDVSTRKLGIDTVDLYLLHQPLPQDFDATAEAYRALERLLEEGGCGPSGCATSVRPHLETVLPRLSVVPAVNQVEVHPYYSQPPCGRPMPPRHCHPGVVTARRRLRLPGRRGRGAAKRVARPGHHWDRRAYGKTAAQVILRWHLDSGRSAIPKSVRPERIAENLDVFDFALTSEEVAAIDGLDTGIRGGPNQDELDFRTFGGASRNERDEDTDPWDQRARGLGARVPRRTVR